MKLENQLATECSEREKDQDDIGSGPKNMATDVCDKGTSMEPSSARLPYVSSATAIRSKSSQCDMPHGKSVEYLKRRRIFDSDNRAALSQANPTLSSPPANETIDENTLGAVGGDTIADKNKNPSHVSSEIGVGAGLDGTSDSCPNLVDCNEARNKEDVRSDPCYRPWALRRERYPDLGTEAFNKKRNAFFESIVENVKSFEMRANRSAADQPMNAASTSANVSSAQYSSGSNSQTPLATTTTLNLPELAPTGRPNSRLLLAEYLNSLRFQHPSTAANLSPILPEPRPREPELIALPTASAASAGSPMHRSYQLFPPPPPFHVGRSINQRY